MVTFAFQIFTSSSISSPGMLTLLGYLPALEVLQKGVGGQAEEVES